MTLDRRRRSADWMGSLTAGGRGQQSGGRTMSRQRVSAVVKRKMTSPSAATMATLPVCRLGQTWWTRKRPTSWCRRLPIRFSCSGFCLRVLRPRTTRTMNQYIQIKASVNCSEHVRTFLLSSRVARQMKPTMEKMMTADTRLPVSTWYVFCTPSKYIDLITHGRPRPRNTFTLLLPTMTGIFLIVQLPRAHDDAIKLSWARTCDVSNGGVSVLVVQRRRATRERVRKWRAQSNDRDSGNCSAQADDATQQTSDLQTGWRHAWAV